MFLKEYKRFHISNSDLFRRLCVRFGVGKFFKGEFDDINFGKKDGEDGLNVCGIMGVDIYYFRLP